MNKPSIILMLMVTLVVSMGCAKSDWIQNTLVTTDVTGTWFGTMGKAPVTSEARLEARQEGAKVTGHFRPLLDYPGWTVKPGPIEGSVAGDTFHFQMVDGSVADLTISGDEMRGTISMGKAGAHLFAPRRFIPTTTLTRPEQFSIDPSLVTHTLPSLDAHPYTHLPHDPGGCGT